LGTQGKATELQT